MNSPKELLEEKWNAYSHAIGIVLGVIGLFLLLKDTIGGPKQWPIIIYGVSVILLFSASTFYHAMSHPKWKRRLRVLDHISIYYLIAGTYTPVCLLVLQDSKGTLLLFLVWGIAFFGTILKLFFTGRFPVFSLLLYGIMGWLIVIDLTFLIRNTSKVGLVLLASGGAFYTLGIGFYAIRAIPYNHLIWHFFVLGGAISHWFLIQHLLSD
ncbi:MAG: hemolysin III family protein [Bacteroidota bacterium]